MKRPTVVEKESMCTDGAEALRRRAAHEMTEHLRFTIEEDDVCQLRTPDANIHTSRNGPGFGIVIDSVIDVVGPRTRTTHRQLIQARSKHSDLKIAIKVQPVIILQ